ncbi:MAG: hypothetical protein U1E78_02140 [Gammaproteobacteria bacterium]
MIELTFEAVLSIPGGQINQKENIRYDERDSDPLRVHIKQGGVIGSSIGFLIGIPLGYPGAVLGSIAGSLTGMGVGTFQWWLNQ